MTSLSNQGSLLKSIENNFAIPYLFCLAIIIGPAYNMYVHYDFSHSIDTESYLAMSNDNFSVNAVHRYRIIIPFFAKLLAIPLKLVYIKLWPHRNESLWPLQLAYFIINSILTAFYGWIVYRLLKLYSNNLIAVIIGLITILTSRWVAYIAGLPLTDSLYLITIAGLLFSIKSKKSVLFVVIVLFGSLAKESFLLFTPVILYLNIFNWRIRTALIVTSLLILLGEHMLIDYLFPIQESDLLLIKHENLIEIVIRHSKEILVTILDLITIRGLGEIFTVIGLFSFILLYGLAHSECRKAWMMRIEKYYLLFFVCILLHALLSGDAARMFYFGSALYALLATITVEKIVYIKNKG